MTLYADVLFAINFSMDFLALFITSIILHKKTTKPKLVLSALLGAFFGVFEIVLPIGMIFTTILSVVISVLMCLIAFFEKNIRRFLLTVVSFWVASMALAGVMSLLYSVLNTLLSSVIKHFSPVTTYNGARFFIIISITALVGIIFSRVFSNKKDVKSIEVKIIIGKKEYKINALCDSGNMLTEPISAKPVILVANKTEISKKISEIDDRYKRYIPYSDTSSCGMLKGVLPSKVYVGNNLVDAVIATTNKEGFSEYEGLVPSSLL